MGLSDAESGMKVLMAFLGVENEAPVLHCGPFLVRFRQDPEDRVSCRSLSWRIQTAPLNYYMAVSKN